MRDRLHPLGLPSLPLPNAEDGPGDGLVIKFKPLSSGTVLAQVYTEDGDPIDLVLGNTFREAYDWVAREYPQAAWDSDDDPPEEEEDEDETESAE